MIKSASAVRLLTRQIHYSDDYRPVSSMLLHLHVLVSE